MTLEEALRTLANRRSQIKILAMLIETCSTSDQLRDEPGLDDLIMHLRQKQEHLNFEVATLSMSKIEAPRK